MSTTYIHRSSEDTEQEIVMQWARLNIGKWPELALLHHIPNGGSRSKKEGARFKRMGVLEGVADLHLPIARAGYHSLYIEMKYRDGKLQSSQKAFLKMASAFGNYCIVCYTAEDAIKAIDAYLHDRVNYESLSIIKEDKKLSTVK